MLDFGGAVLPLGTEGLAKEEGEELRSQRGSAELFARAYYRPVSGCLSLVLSPSKGAVADNCRDLMGLQICLRPYRHF
jgi:hypothetical protein